MRQRSLAPLLVPVIALLISASMRLQFPVGSTLGPDYDVLPLPVVGLTLLLSFGGWLLLPGNPTRRRSMLTLLVVLLISDLLITWQMPDFSLLQLLYYILAGILLGMIGIYRLPSPQTLIPHLKRLWLYRHLLLLWMRYNILSRYSQTVLGILWIVLLPLSTSVILAFVFSSLLHPRDVGNIPFMPFFLCGFTFWGLFLQGTLNGTQSLLSRLPLMNQVYFPREILVLIKVGEALVDWSFTFAIMLLVNALYGIFPSLTSLYVVPLLAIQVILIQGITFFTSCLSVLIRDIPQLVNIIVQLLFYFTPVLYPLTILPDGVRHIMTIFNPMAALITAYRDVLLYNRSPALLTLVIPTLMACILFLGGYASLKTYEDILADYR